MTPFRAGPIHFISSDIRVRLRDSRAVFDLVVITPVSAVLRQLL